MESSCAVERKALADEFELYRKVFIALGDENRQGIFIALLEHEPIGMRVPEITEKTHLSRPAVSHHLKILKEAGLIEMQRVGTRNYYYVSAAERCWGGLKRLVSHVDDVVRAANQNGYPHLIDRQRLENDVSE